MTYDEERLVDDLLNSDHGMSCREVEFLDSLDQNYRGKTLSPRQSDWLQNIGQRVLS